MHDEALVRGAKDDPSGIGYVLAGALTLAALTWWLSDLTAGTERGGRYDLPVLNSVTWLAFLFFATVAFMSLVGATLRLVETIRPERDRRSPR